MDKRQLMEAILKALFEILASVKGTRHIWNLGTADDYETLKVSLRVTFWYHLTVQKGKGIDINRVIYSLFKEITDKFDKTIFDYAGDKPVYLSNITSFFSKQIEDKSS